VPGHTNLYRREGGSFYFVRRIPTKVLPAYVRKNGKQQRFIKIALKTKDPAEARRLVRVRSAEVQAEFDEVERKPCQPMRDTATEAELIAMACRWLHDAERHAAGNTAWMTDLDRDEVEPLISESQDREGAFHGDAGEGDVARLATALMAKHRLQLPPGPERAMLYELAKRAMVEHERRRQERLVGRMVGASFDPVFASVGALNRPPVPTKPLSFDDLLGGWKIERRPPEKTLGDFRRALNRLAAHVGHNDPRRVTKGDIAGWKAAMLAEGRSEGTVGNALIAVQSIFGVALRSDLIPTNPATDVSMPAKNGGRKAGRLPFTDDEAKLILAAARGQRGYRRWIPWLLAYTGARLEEVAQALVSDVRQEDGHWVLEVSAGDGKVLKNEGSARLIPLHPALLREGFLEFVAAQREAGEPVLFSDAAPDRFGRRGGSATKVLGRWLRVNLGIVDKRKVAGHSWRHRFKDLCRRCGVPKDVHDALTGHAAGDVGSTYGLGFTVGTLAEAIAKLPDQCPPGCGGRLIDMGQRRSMR
jgi:integrase